MPLGFGWVPNVENNGDEAFPQSGWFVRAATAEHATPHGQYEGVAFSRLLAVTEAALSHDMSNIAGFIIQL